MAGLILEFVDAVPLQGNENALTFELQRWLATLVDVLNSTIQALQNALNNNVLVSALVVPSYTTTEIMSLAVTAVNGSMWYCTDSSPPNIVLYLNGGLVQLTTAPFP